jgi:formylmethanofuran dehydrogenase subunit B
MTVVNHAVCTFCGCTCDDIELITEGDRIAKARHACSLGESWFTNHTAEAHYPAALVEAPP